MSYLIAKPHYLTITRTTMLSINKLIQMQHNCKKPRKIPGAKIITITNYHLLQGNRDCLVHLLPNMKRSGVKYVGTCV